MIVDHWAQIDRDLPTMRALAAAGMRDMVRVTRADPDGETVADDMGNVIPAPPLVVWEGRAKVQTTDTYPSTPVAGSAQWTTAVRQIHIPYGNMAVRSGDMVEILESQNPRIVGMVVRIRIEGDKTWNTATRFNVVEVVRDGR